MIAQRLSLQTNSTGSRHACARLSDSSSMPWFIAPSPKNPTPTAPGRSRCAASAKPHAIGAPAPTIPEEAARCSAEKQVHVAAARAAQTVLAAEHLRSIASRSTPRATRGGVERWSTARPSPSRRCATTPAAIASSPMPRCISPQIRPSRHSSARASSKQRMRAISPNRARRGSIGIDSSLYPPHRRAACVPQPYPPRAVAAPASSRPAP